MLLTKPFATFANLQTLKAGKWEVPVGKVRLLKILMRLAPRCAARLIRDS